MYKTVILPLDGSLFAELAIGTAVEIARRSGGLLVLTRVHESYVYEDAGHSRADHQSRRDQEEYLAEAAERIDTQFGIQPGRVLLDGPIATAICRFADNMESPLIVISTHGRTGFSRLWLGSTADEIAHHASVPVLMLRHQESVPLEDSSPHLFKRILVPLDGSDLAESVLEHATALAAAYGARLTLFRVVAPLVAPALLYAAPYLPAPERYEDTDPFRAEAATNYVTALAARLRHEDENLLVDTDVRIAESAAPAILEAVDAHEADTVVMATHGRGASRLIVASVADKVIRGGPEAVLIVNGERRGNAG